MVLNPPSDDRRLNVQSELNISRLRRLSEIRGRHQHLDPIYNHALGM